MVVWHAGVAFEIFCKPYYFIFIPWSHKVAKIYNRHYIVESSLLPINYNNMIFLISVVIFRKLEYKSVIFTNDHNEPTWFYYKWNSAQQTKYKSPIFFFVFSKKWLSMLWLHEVWVMLVLINYGDGLTSVPIGNTNCW